MGAARICHRVTLPLVAALSISALCVGPGVSAAESTAKSISAPRANDKDTTAQIRQNIDRYRRSINEASVDLASGLWLQTPEAGFIHPLGAATGWQQIKEDFYLTLMGKTFSKRELKLVGDPRIRVFNCAAMAEFNWDFVATRRDTGQEIHTTGRESQLYVKQANGQWLLAHVHYSGPALNPDGSSKGL